MGSWLKAFVVVAVTLPIAAYVVATISASPAEPTPRDTVILRDPTPEPSRTPAPAQQRGQDDGPDERGDGGVTVVTPSPKRVGDDDAAESGSADDAAEDPERERDDTDDDTSDDGDD